MPTPIIDSHIHLFPASHLPTLAWYTPSSPLGSQHSIDEYRLATASTPTSPEETNSHYLRGFIFLETDRISSIEESDPTRGWGHALDEVSFLTRIITGDPIPGEGHKDVDRHLCLGMIPWAPVPGGPAALEKYISLVRERTRTEEVFKKVRGVRYLVQDKPSGVMLKPEFIDGLRWLGRQQLAFDLGVDARQGGMWQLREAAEMMNTVYRGVDEKKDRVRIVISMFVPYFPIRVSAPLSLGRFGLTSICRPPVQAEPASAVHLARLDRYASGFPGMELPHHSHGTASNGVHEAFRWILGASPAHGGFGAGYCFSSRPGPAVDGCGL